MVAEPQLPRQNFAEMGDDDDQVDQAYDVLASGDAEAYRSLKMTVKVPPAFDWHVQTNGYFAYEESVE